MRFSLRTLGLIVVWAAILAGLICQIRWEIVNVKWPSGIASDAVWTLNLIFALVIVLLAVATRTSKQIFWIGCAVVAVSLFVCQATELQPRALSRYLSYLLLSVLVPADSSGAQIIEAHKLELGSVLIYSAIPILSLAGGWFTQWVHSRNDSELFADEAGQ
ncbi:MAG: hypothetical protein AB8B55_06790 [Mariniblastus sp.]